MAFQADIRVKAYDANQPIGDPEHCWMRTEGLCSVQAGRKPLVLRSKELELWSEGESLFRRDETQWSLVKGSVRVRSDSEAQIKFPYGRLRTKGGEFWSIEMESKFLVRAIKHDVEIDLMDGRLLSLPEGLEIWVGGVGSSGGIAHGVPALIPIEDHLRRWSSLKDISVDRFITETRQLKDRWKHRKEISSSIYRQVAERHLASFEQRQSEEHSRKENAKRERERFRKLLHQRAFER